jgi:hypothetical protein
MFIQKTPTQQLTRASRAAVAKHGLEACLKAYYLNHVVGEGPALIGGWGRGGVARGDAMINAGRELVTGSRE